MKLKPDLLKKILVWGEDHLPDNKRSWSTKELEFKGDTEDEITFHVYLLWQNGYIECTDISSLSEKEYFFDNLTMNGYQYLNLLRSKAWKTAQGLIKDLGVIFVEGAINAVINKYIPPNLP